MQRCLNLNLKPELLPPPQSLLQRGSFTAESAAGVYFEERQTALKCLLKMLAEVATGITRGGSGGAGGEAGGGQPQQQGPYSAIIRSFVEELLDQQQQPAAGGAAAGGTATAGTAAAGAAGTASSLVSRIVALLKDNSLDPAPTSRLPAITDEAGIPAGRALMLQV